MKKSKNTCIGSIGKPRGLKGEFFLNSYCSPEKNIINYKENIRLEDNSRIKFKYIKTNNSKFIAKIDGINNIDLAKEYTNKKIYILQEDLPELLDDEVYWNELIGMIVVDVNENTILGTVEDLNNFGSNDCLVVNPTSESIDNEKRLIPFVRDTFIKSVSFEKQVIKVNWRSDY
tara:strand:+ start:88 stop:609 length:522 start_codon:yes stop_codon:yes gene_type:complete